ncbi:hypothetical protein Q7C36_011863 [Tachysurus vachellii]|uniref:Ig-like domain-containing protein n=1 Tax=Tachysurus vachellii TaxID=175792 RepID=A0AA88SSE7_TACVA|nr:hypothetical protein Q7C36_011863 [Tachysurus vachellii]
MQEVPPLSHVPSTFKCQQLIQVQQEPEDLVLSPGSSLKVSCSIKGTSNPDLFWYRWNETAGFILVFTSRGAGMMDPTSYGQFKSKRPKDLQMILESDGVNESDGSAVCTMAIDFLRAGHTSPPGTRESDSFLWIITENFLLYNCTMDFKYIHAAHTGQTGHNGPGTLQRIIAKGLLFCNRHK